MCVCVYLYLYICMYVYLCVWKTMENYSSMRKKKILPFVTTWVGLEGIMVNEISQIKQILNDLT